MAELTNQCGCGYDLIKQVENLVDAMNMEGVLFDDKGNVNRNKMGHNFCTKCGDQIPEEQKEVMIDYVGVYIKENQLE